MNEKEKIQEEKRLRYEKFWKYVASALDNEKAKKLLEAVLPEKDKDNIINLKGKDN